MLVGALAPLRTMELASVVSGPMTSFATLRAERHTRWLDVLRGHCGELLQQPMADGGWPERLVAAGSGGDVIAMDRARWQALPSHASAIWRAVAQEAIPLLELEAA